MSADEFDVIRTLFAPLATSVGARGLVDDAAVLESHGKLVVTTDAIVEGVHFLPDDPIETIAMKALRVNVSDLIAKGARPTAALLTLVWPHTRPAEDIKAFAEGLARDLQSFGISLLGGDTTSTSGPLVVSITAFGEPVGDRVPSRADAQSGEDVWLIGGEIGSAWFGLQLRQANLGLEALKRGRNEIEAAQQSRQLSGSMPDYFTLPGQDFDAEAAWLLSTYLAPFVRVESLPIIARFARASMDISDGLLADARKLAAASGVKLRFEANAIPLAIPVMRWVQTGGDFGALVTGGDDYVVLFTAPSEHREAIAAAEGSDALRLTRIGSVHSGEGVDLVDRDGNPIIIPESGYVHRLGR
jgi:thiamine-monophosphate kinase